MVNVIFDTLYAESFGLLFNALGNKCSLRGHDVYNNYIPRNI